MKTLLTLILFLIYQVGIGQSFVGKWGKLTNADENIRPSIIHNDSLDNIKEEEWIDVYTSASLLRLWKAYQQECWNDSTKTKIININPDRNIITEISPGCYSSTLMWFSPKYDTVWEHKQPTFEGFMQYLERKVK